MSEYTFRRQLKRGFSISHFRISSSDTDSILTFSLGLFVPTLRWFCRIRSTIWYDMMWWWRIRSAVAPCLTVAGKVRPIIIYSLDVGCWCGNCQEYSGCSCTAGTSTDGHSVDCVNDCSLYGAYWFILFLAVVSQSVTQVAFLMIFIRSVR